MLNLYPDLSTFVEFVPGFEDNLRLLREWVPVVEPLGQVPPHRVEEVKLLLQNKRGFFSIRRISIINLPLHMSVSAVLTAYKLLLLSHKTRNN